MLNGLSRILKEIRRAQSVMVAGHINPDGDCLGSMMALGLGLRAMGKRVVLLCEGRVPRMYHELPGISTIRSPGRAVRADLAISVDCNMPQMLGDRILKLFKRSRVIIEIDHHPYRVPFGTVTLVDTDAAAVGEIIYRVLLRLGVDIDLRIARHLLTSIIVETNSYRLPPVRPETFTISAALLKTGVDFHKISEMVYWSKTPQAALLEGVCLSRAVFQNKGAIVSSVVREKDFKRVKGKDEDVDAVADVMRSIKGVRVAVLFREQDKKSLRVSLRSKRGLNVARVAQQFAGGGHGDVAGCFIENKPQAMQALLREVARLIT